MHTTIEASSEINEAGTPQGGVISPLLMNIALHGMENHVLNEFGRSKVKVIRYADDFVIFGKTLEDVQKAEKLVSEFLKPIGLNLSEEKTRIDHSMKAMPKTTGPVGLNFRNVQCSIHRGVNSTRGIPQKFKLMTKPSREAVTRQKRALSLILLKYKGAPIGSVVERLSRRIKGWTWYHSVTQSTLTFSKLDAWFWRKLWGWAKNRHRTAKKAKQKCFIM